MQGNIYRQSLAAAWILLLAATLGCCPRHVAADESPANLAPMVKNLARAAEASGDASTDLQGMDFLKQATAHDPGLLSPFDGYRLAVRREETHVGLLVCDSEGKLAYFEDAGCTATVEKNYSAGDLPPCKAVLNLAETCGGGL
jgi:hypothetical protein